MNRIIALIIKELLSVWRDPRSRFSLLVPPLVQLFIFAFAATLDVKDVPIGILNRDTGKWSFELIQRFKGTPTFKRIIYLQSVQEITPFIDNQKGVVVLSIDEEFSKKMEEGQMAEVQLILDGRKSNTAQIVQGYMGTIVSSFNRDVAKKLGYKMEKTVLVTRNWYNPNLIYYWYNIPSLVATLSMLTALVVTSITVARERELGTFDQLLVSPLSSREILIGKIVPGIIVGLLEGTLMMCAGVFVFNIPFTGSLLLFFFSLFIFICSACGLGVFISSLCSTQQQAMLGTFVLMVPSVLISGFATPIENMPGWLQPFTYLISLKYMLVISKGIFLKAMPAKFVLQNVWPMALIAIFTITSSSLMFRKRLQ